jgi:hypothetical protein
LEETDDNFYLMNKSKPEIGHSSECKTCAKQRSLKNGRENKERQAEAYKRWSKKNRDHRMESRRSYLSIPEKRLHVTTKTRNYLRDNPDKSKQYGIKREQHKKHIISSKEWIACKTYFKNCCAYCGLPIEEHFYTRLGITKQGDFHKEHKEDEGANDLSNCVPSCGKCNSSKWKFVFEEWYVEFNPVFSKTRLNRINKWVNGGYKKYIEENKTRKKSEDSQKQVPYNL